jgi:putative peptidoglycan lipid II flippase
VAVIVGLGLRPFIATVFGFSAQQTDLLLWVTRGYLFGLAGHFLLEVAARSFFARQNAIIPLIGSVINVIIYIAVGTQLFRPMGAAGISLTDSLAFTAQAVFVIFMLNRRMVVPFSFRRTVIRGVFAAILSGVIVFMIQYWIGFMFNPLLVGVVSMGLGTLAVVPFVWPELRSLVRL